MKKIYILLVVLFLCLFNKSVDAKKYYDSTSNEIFLTFDDGYSLKNTKEIFKICEAKKVPVTFFVHGDFLESCQTMIKTIASSKYASIGCHTVAHKDITKMTHRELEKDILKYEAIYTKITGKLLPKYFRPPMGLINNEQEVLIESMGYKIIMWNVSYYDYNYQLDKGLSYVLTNLKTQTKPGSIILMHTMLNSNVKALPLFIDYAKSAGYVFQSLDNLK